jgi:hypothetical protein
MENHGCIRGEEEERVGEDGVRNGVVQTTGHDTDAVRKIQSGMHLCFPEYIFWINTILVNEGKVGSSCRVRDVPDCIIQNTSA